MVRHGESPKDGNERTRGLTDKGKLDAQRVSYVLIEEGIEAVISSPNDRSILTVQQLAIHLGQEVLVFENFKERTFTSEDKRISDEELFTLLIKSFSKPNFALLGGESNVDFQKRAIKVLKRLLNTYQGRKVVIGTHRTIMALMMGYYDSKYDLNFLLHTSKPDI